MPEVKVEVVPVGIQYLCDSCGNGYMAREDIGLGGSMLLTNPPKYKHKCNNCWVEEYLTETYPTIRYEFKEEE